MDNWIIKQKIDFARPVSQQGAPDVLMLPGDNLAHTWQVACLKNDIPVDLSGASVTAYFLRTDGNAVMVTGEVSGNIASVTLAQECYAFAGGLRAVMRITDPETEAVVSMAEHAFVVRPAVDAGGIIDPGEVIPSIDELIAKIDEMEEATAAAEAAATKSVRYDAAQTISAEGQEIARNNISVESAEDIKVNTGAKAIKFINGAYMPTGNLINFSEDIVRTSTWRYAVLECAPGDAFTITVEGGSTARPVGFYRSDYTLIKKADALTLNDQTVIAPADSAYLVINDKSLTSTCFIGVPVADRATTLEADVAEMDALPLRAYKQANGVISGTGETWVNVSGPSHKHIVVPVKPNDVVEIIGNSTSALNLGFLKSYVVPIANNEVVDRSTTEGFTERITVASKTYLRYVIPDDTHYVFLGVVHNGIERMPTSFKVNGYDYMLSVAQNNAQTKEAMNAQFEAADVTPLSGLELHLCSINSNGTWGPSGGNYQIVVFPIKSGVPFSIEGGSTTLYAVLKSKPIVSPGGTIPYSDDSNWNSRKDASTTPSGTLPDDAKYMAIVVLYNGEDSSPTSLIIDGIDYVKTVYENMRDLMSKVNMIMARLNIE